MKEKEETTTKDNELKLQEKYKLLRQQKSSKSFEESEKLHSNSRNTNQTDLKLNKETIDLIRLKMGLKQDHSNTDVAFGVNNKKRIRGTSSTTIKRPTKRIKHKEPIQNSPSSHSIVSPSGSDYSMSPSSSSFSSSYNPNALFIGNLGEFVNESDIESIFSPFGPIESIRIVSSKKIAFLRYSHHESAEKALNETIGATLDGNPITIARAFRPGSYQSRNREISPRHTPKEGDSSGTERVSGYTKGYYDEFGDFHFFKEGEGPEDHLETNNDGETAVAGDKTELDSSKTPRPSPFSEYIERGKHASPLVYTPDPRSSRPLSSSQSLPNTRSLTSYDDL